MPKRLPLPTNKDGLWRKYFGVGQYHHYNTHQLFAAWQHQVADCGRASRTGNGAYSPLRQTDEFYQPVCGKCRKLNIKPTRSEL